MGCRKALYNMSTMDQNLVLETFGLPVPRVVERSLGRFTGLLQDAGDEILMELGQHFGVLANEPMPSLAHGHEPEPLFVFASHLAAHRGFLAEVQTRLRLYGVSIFVAHDSIPMDAEWAKEIVDALNACHAGAAFLHPGFGDSFYCQQECGWMLGRGIPLARLMLGESPRALLGEHQGKNLVGRTAAEVADSLMDWATGKLSIQVNLAESLTICLKHSGSFSQTDLIWRRLSEIEDLTPDQLRRVVSAAEYNGQVFGTGIGGFGGTPYRWAIGNKASTWDTSEAFTARIEALKTASTPAKIIEPPEDERGTWMDDAKVGPWAATPAVQ